ncbi:hypothetical protein IW150_006214, partial [Coemansia sp. RSA 2607]
MSRKHSQASANSKTSSSQQPTLTYAQLAGNNSGKSSNASTPAPATPAPAPSSAASQPTVAPASQPNPPKSFSAAAKQDNRQRTPTNGAGNQSNSNSGNTSGVSGHGGAGGARGGNANNNATSGGAGARNREAAVRLPSRNSVSSAATPNIQFGTLNKQARPQTPPTAQKQASGAASATSGGAMPANMTKPAAKPSFGSIKSHGDDNNSGNAGNKRSANGNNNSGNAADSNTRQHHGRQQQQQHGQQQNHHQQQQQRSGSRASNQSRQSQNHPGFKHG